MEKKQNAQTPESVPYIVHEGALARSERQIKRMWIALIVAFAAIVLVTGGFLWYLNQYDFVSNETVTVDGADGVANYIGKDGNIYNGEGNSQTDKGANQKKQLQGENAP